MQDPATSVARQVIHLSQIQHVLEHDRRDFDMAVRYQQVVELRLEIYARDMQILHISSHLEGQGRKERR